MNKANECTCPSGDGSLVHPCPAHPAVEQAGGDERDFQAEGAQEVPSPVSQEYDRHLISLLRKGEALPGHQEEAADEIERLRDWNDHLNNTVLPNILNPTFLMLMKGGERLLDLCTKDGEFIGVSLNDMKDVFDWMVTHARIAPDQAALAQPSPAQAKQAEQPEVVARVDGTDEDWFIQPEDETELHNEGLLFAGCELGRMIDFDRIVGALRAENAKLSEALDECDGDRWKLRSERDAANARLHEVATACATAEQERDAALARVAELEQKSAGSWTVDTSCGRPILMYEGCSVIEDQTAYEVIRMIKWIGELERQEPVATIAKVPGEDWNGLHFYRDLQGMQPGTKLYAAPVAQAQHSVPEGWMLMPVEPLLNMMSDKDHDTRITAERQLLSILAAAPGKEVDHE